ncbi:MAG TPA: hypothetical protein VGN72_19495 [Tepidisphaeraceae bacterium]|jgi:hypothetical protein|nr:hypothetical protein [Tepidisphaeraceae bacterium]
MSQFRKVTVALSLFIGLSSTASTAQTTTQPADPQRYLQVVQRTADTLLDTGVDTYGSEKTGMILSVLDRKTGKPLTKLPKAPHGVRWGDRTGPGGSNANLQQDLYRTLYHLSRITGDKRYAEASDKALSDFLRIAQHSETGLYAWGEHLYWNCVKDMVGDHDPGNTHEPKRPFATIERALELEPESVIAYARGLWEYQITNKEDGNFSRHGKWHRLSSGKDMDFEKEASYFIDTWSHAYAHTKDPLFDKATRILTQRYLDRMNDRNLLDLDSSGRDVSKNKTVPLWMVSMAIETHGAIDLMPPETAKVLAESARRHDEGFLALKHEPADPQKGFLYYAYTDSGLPHPDKAKETDGYSRAWGLGYGVNSTSMFVPLLYTRQAQLGQTPEGDAYRKLILQAADLYKTARPTAEQDIWAGEYGTAIFTELAAYRLSGDAASLDAARELGDLAITALWDDGKTALPSGSSKTNYYDVTTYPDTAIFALLALHEAVNGLEPKVPISDSTR